jgi:hypothetical protein
MKRKLLNLVILDHPIIMIFSHSKKLKIKKYKVNELENFNMKIIMNDQD